MIEEYMESVESGMYGINGLEPLTRCCIGISAVTRCDGRDYQSEAVLLCNQTMDGIPGEVEDLTLSSPNPTSLYVTWSPPSNYSNPSLVYDIRWKSDDSLIDSCMGLDQLYCFIDGLNQSTWYVVTVTAMSSVGSGPSKSDGIQTGADVPSVPEDVMIKFNGCDMTVSWSHDDKQYYDVEEYMVRVHCNQQDIDKSVSSTQMSTTINICGEGITALSWCIAQVRASNSIGYGSYSPFVEAVYPQSTPSTPLCFVSEDLGYLVAISFTITAPYSLDTLGVNYTVSPEPANPHIGNHSFTGSNVLNFTGLDRTIVYDFSLILCDEPNDDCSPPCQVTFTPSQVRYCCQVNIGYRYTAWCTYCCMEWLVFAQKKQYVFL